MLAPQPKDKEIMDKLAARIDARVPLSEFEFASIKREIERLPQAVDFATRRMLLALAYGAAGDAAQAKSLFESLLEDAPDALIVINYRAYLKRVREYGRAITLTYQFAERFKDPELVKEAHDMALFFEYDLRKSTYWLSEHLKYLTGDVRTSVLDAANKWAQELRGKLELVALDEQSLPALSAISYRVASAFNIDLNNSNLYVHEGLLSLELEAARGPHAVTEQQLNDANFELAMSIADDELLFDKPVTAFFRFANPPSEAVIG